MKPLVTVQDYRRLVERHGGGRGTIEISNHNVILIRVRKPYIPDIKQQVKERAMLTVAVVVEELTMWQKFTLWSIKVL